MSYRLVSLSEFSEICPICGSKALIIGLTKPIWLKGAKNVVGMTKCCNCDFTIIVIKDKALTKFLKRR